MCNGGSAQYCVNSSGNHAHLAVKALRAIGATGTAEIVQRPLDLFGPDGPDRNRRHDQLAALSPEQDAASGDSASSRIPSGPSGLLARDRWIDGELEQPCRPWCHR